MGTLEDDIRDSEHHPVDGRPYLAAGRIHKIYLTLNATSMIRNGLTGGRSVSELQGPDICQSGIRTPRGLTLLTDWIEPVTKLAPRTLCVRI